MTYRSLVERNQDATHVSGSAHPYLKMARHRRPASTLPIAPSEGCAGLRGCRVAATATLHTKYALIWPKRMAVGPVNLRVSKTTIPNVLLHCWATLKIANFFCS